MKKFSFLFLLLVLVVVVGCKKNTDVDTYPPTELDGKWNYTGSSLSESSTASMSGTVLNFTPKSYRIIVNHQVTQTGTYAIVTDSLQHQAVKRIIYDGDTEAPKTFYKLDNGILTMFSAVSVSAGGTENYFQAD